MPKKTFFKIDQNKRERIMQAAAGLFAERGFTQTDMAELAERAGVAKGSIYNYFDTKEELYLYVCRDGIDRSRQAVYGEMDQEWDICRQIEHMFRQGTRFIQSHPEYLILYANIASAGMNRFSEKLSLEVEKFTADYLKTLIRRDAGRGVIRKDVDVEFAAFWINSLYIMFMTSLVSSHFEIRMREYLEIKGELDQRTVERLIQRTVGMINRWLKQGER